MGKIKLNISGNLVRIVLPSTQSFQWVREHLKMTVIKNYKLLKTVRSYHLDNLSFNDDELLELQKVIESLVGLKSIEKLEKDDKKKVEKAEIKLYYGNLRSGEKLSSDTNIIILGNLNPGSHVKSKKSIFVYGKARGTLEAGANPNKYQSSSIYVEEVENTKIRIGGNHIMYDKVEETKNIIFEKKAGEILARKISEKEIRQMLKRIGFHMI